MITATTPTFMIKGATGIASLCLAVIAVTLISACSRTGPLTPDTRPLAPPLCSNNTNTIRVTLTRDPDIPTAKMMSKVTWNFQRTCATSIPPDPAQGRGGRQSNHCFVTQYARGNTEYSGNCEGGPANWRVQSSSNQPERMSFDFFGNILGNICISGRAEFTDGTSMTFGPRMWRVASGIPEIMYLLTARPVDPTLGWSPASSDGCPDT
jgi:hypothetical protein